MKDTQTLVHTEQRSAIYGLLAEIYINEVSKDLLEQIKAQFYL